MHASVQRQLGSPQVGAYHPTPTPFADAPDLGGSATELAPLWRAVRRAADVVRRGSVDAVPCADLIAERPGYGLDALCVAWRDAYLNGCIRARDVQIADRGTLDRLRAAFIEQVSLLPVRPDAGETLRMLAALEAVRERVDRDESHQFRRALGGLSAMDLVVEVSHDMRSPLAAILLLTDALRHAEPAALSPVAQRQIGLVYSAAFGLHAMANDVIELARGGGRLFDPEPMSFSVTDLMQSAADIVRPMAEEKQLAVHVAGPRGDSRVGHPLALSRVLVNLMTNALKFTREGEVRVTARELSRTEVEFVVEDTGIGIPPDVMAALFEPFRRHGRGGAHENAFSSAGLGLAICRRLVNSMGSDLRVETEVGKGTRFRFQVTLPEDVQAL